MEKEKLHYYVDKVVECLTYKNTNKQVHELQKVIEEIWEDGKDYTRCPLLEDD